MKAIYKGQLLAESDDTVVVEGKHYFPRESLVEACFSESEHSSYCGWKGDCSYLNVNVPGADVNANAAWYYAEPYEAAAQIKGRVAFWKGVEVNEA